LIGRTEAFPRVDGSRLPFPFLPLEIFPIALDFLSASSLFRSDADPKTVLFPFFPLSVFLFPPFPARASPLRPRPPTAEGVLFFLPGAFPYFLFDLFPLFPLCILSPFFSIGERKSCPSDVRALFSPGIQSRFFPSRLHVHGFKKA